MVLHRQFLMVRTPAVAQALSLSGLWLCDPAQTQSTKKRTFRSDTINH